MTSLYTPPSTLDGIKRRAKAIKRDRSVPHHQALDFAAHEAGYENIRHAQAVLARTAPEATIYLTCYWVGESGGIRKAGRETLAISMAKSLNQIVSRHQLDHARHLAAFRIDSADHLERRLDVKSIEDAKTELRHAARSLQFMAATGLTPATTQRQHQLIERKVKGLPGRDHASLWVKHDVDGSAGWVFMDEPYMKPELAIRAEWASQQGLTMVRPSWNGLYSPNHAIPFLFGADEPHMASIEAKLMGLPVSDDASSWRWMSEGYFTDFASPARKASGKSRRARPMPAPFGVERGGSLPYGARVGGAPSLWRPAHRMPLEMHLAVGSLFRALAVSGLAWPAAKRLGEVRSLLDDWIQREYPGDEMSADQSHAAYYGGSASPILEPAQQLATVREIRETLTRGYKACKPRDKLLAELVAVEANFAEWSKLRRSQ